MKKYLAIFMAILMILSIAACDSGNEPAENDPTNPPVSGDGDVIVTTLWSLTYDSVWTYDEEEDFLDEDDYSQIILSIPDGDDSYLVSVEIRASVEDAGDFRDYLNSYGFDQYEYAVNNAYDLIKIGGVDCLKQEGNYWGEPCLRYFGRNEGAGTTVFVEITGDYEDDRVDALLTGLTFKLTDTGNVDAPWYWEGEAFSADDMSATAGNVTVNSKWIPFDESFITTETFDHAVAVVGDKAYILSEGILKQYAYDGNTLTFVKDIELDGEYEYISEADDGSLWLSAFGEDLVNLNGDKVVASYEDLDNVAMHPTGTWGISWFTSAECNKVTISGGTASTTSMTFSEVDSVMNLFVDKDYIYVCGSAVDDSGHKVFIYDTEGKLQKTLTGADGEGLGSITYIAKTKDAFIGMDGNMREVVLWNADGNYIGSIEDSELFGTSYPWFCSSSLLDDGSILTVMTEDRADESGMELIAFTLGGF